MGAREQWFHGCAFRPPAGFVVMAPACACTATQPGCDCLGHPEPGGHQPPALSLTLIRRVGVLGVADYSNNPADLRPALFPATLTLTTQGRAGFPTPLDYLRTAEAALAPGLPDYRLDFCRARRLQGQPAAWVQSRFRSHLELLRLGIVWEQGPRLLIAALLAEAGWGRPGWRALAAFAASVRYPRSAEVPPA
jgi:hypothetical protein